MLCELITGGGAQALPSVGGTPPAPPTRTVAYKSKYLHQPHSATSNGMFHKAQMPMQSQMPMQLQMPMQAMMAPPDLERTSLCAQEADMSDDSGSDDEDSAVGGGGGRGIRPTAKVAESGGGSSTFQIERKTTVQSDSKDHKVCIALLELSPRFRYFATPALEAKAYLQVQAVNTSAFTLLKSESVAVFFDGSFVCSTHIKGISPGESFSVFLGADAAVKVEHKLLKKSSNEGAAGSFLQSKKDSKLVYEYLTLVHNTKGTPIEISVVELLPRSTDEKIVVDVVEPAVLTAASAEGVAAHTGEGQLKLGSAMKNKITNNVVFSRALAPMQKIDIAFSYSVQWPHDRHVEIS
jgi:uncharacterized protein (TIGR02231 family)